MTKKYIAVSPGFFNDWDKANLQQAREDTKALLTRVGRGATASASTRQTTQPLDLAALNAAHAATLNYRR